MEWVIVVLISIMVLSPDDGGKYEIDMCVGNCPITVCKDEED